MTCEWCGLEHEFEESCPMGPAPHYFYFTDFPKKFNWSEDSIETFVVPCVNQSDVEAMGRYVREGLKVTGWTVADYPPRGNNTIEVVSGTAGVTFVYRWASGIIEEARSWSGHRRTA